MVKLVTFGDVGGMVGYILASRKPPQQTRTFRYGPVVFGEKVIRSGEQPWQNISVRVETNIGPAPPRDFEYLPCQVLGIVPRPNTAEAVRENSVGVALIERRKSCAISCGCGGPEVRQRRHAAHYLPSVDRLCKLGNRK